MEVRSAFFNLQISDTAAVSLSLSLNEKAGNSSKTGSSSTGRWVIVVLDNSGSMGGAGITQAQQSINELVRVSLTDDPLLKFSIVEFNSYASTRLHRSGDTNNICSIVNSIRATGGTDFVSAFNEVTKLVTTAAKAAAAAKENVFIVFFTDGCDGSSVPTRQKAMAELKTSLETYTAGAALHTIGFTSSHDARLLGDITSIGTTQGTFQYVANSTVIKEAVSSLVALLAVKNAVVAKLFVAPKLSLARPYLEKKVFFSEAGPSTFTATTFMPTGLLDADNQVTLIVSVGSMTHEFVLPHTAEREAPTTSQSIEFATTYVTDSLMQLAQELFGQTKPTNEALLRGQATVKEFDQQIQVLFDQIMKLKLRTQKKTLMPLVEDVTAHLAEFHRALSSAMANQLTNETIAKLNSLAYKKVTKRSLAKKLDQRVEDNAVLFEKLDVFIESAVSKLKEDQLKEKYGNTVDTVGQCMLSCKNWIDAILDSDCMCIAINVTRSEAAIADPSQVVVHSISPTFITADSFLESVEYALTRANNFNAPEDTHGGFDKRATPSVVVGQAREAISAALPLYISDEHWSIAKHKMKPVMGWVTTLDVLGYTSSQIKAIPFLAMATAAREAFGESSTAFKVFQYELIFQTCKQIVRDFSQPGAEFNMANDLKTLYDKYATDSSIRTVDIIPNNWIFVMQLHCAISTNLIPPLPADVADKFILAIAEEELRRRPPPSVYNTSDADLLLVVRDMFGISEEIFVAPTVKAYRDATSEPHQNRLQRITQFYEKKLNALEEGAAAVLEEGVEEIRDCLVFSPDIREDITKLEASLNVQVFDGKIEILAPKAHALISDYEKSFSMNVFSLVTITKLLLAPQLPSNKGVGLASLGPYDHHVWMSLVIQNALQNKNADRRDAIEKGKYLDPFEHSNEILKRLHAEIVQELKEKHIRDTVTAMNTELSLKVSGYVQKFKAYFGDLLAKWNSISIEQYYKLHPYKPLQHTEPICKICTHNKPEYAGFRCVCGCTSCFTSYYYDVQVKSEAEQKEAELEALT